MILAILLSILASAPTRSALPFAPQSTKTAKTLLQERKIQRAIESHDPTAFLFATMISLTNPCESLTIPVPTPNDCEGYLDPACVTACLTTFNANLIRAKRFACSELRQHIVDLNQCFDDALAIYDVCISSGLDSSYCYGQYTVNCHTCVNNRAVQDSETLGAWNVVVASELATYESCTDACCLPWW
jgi:hypothetical protein